MKDCIFCKIINGDAPCYKIYEDPDTLAFLSIANDYYGHTLVIPKKHFESLLDADEKTTASVMKAVQKISNHYVKNLGYDGVNVFVNNGEASGQVVFHLHAHIAPRKKGVPHNWNTHTERDFKAEQQLLKLDPKF